MVHVVQHQMGVGQLLADKVYKGNRLKACSRSELWKLLAFNKITYPADCTHSVALSIAEGTGKVWPHDWKGPPQGWRAGDPHPDDVAREVMDASLQNLEEVDPDDMGLPQLRRRVKELGLSQTNTDGAVALRERLQNHIKPSEKVEDDNQDAS